MGNQWRLYNMYGSAWWGYGANALYKMWSQGFFSQVGQCYKKAEAAWVGNEW